jgi:hypothetical protein
MAYSVSWPLTLPQTPQKGFQETVGALIQRTSMDAGPAKMRRRAARPDTMSLQYIMTTAEVDTLTTFVLDTLDGTTRFGFPHPRKGTVVEVRIVPQGDGQLFQSQYLAPGYWTISLQLEILP